MEGKIVLGKQGIFVQLGATRDGLDPYLDAAHRRGMTAVLVETPDYIRWREVLGRRPFDLTVSVQAPSDPVAVADALSQVAGQPTLLLAGFERYAASALSVARRTGAAPGSASPGFCAPFKRGQRAAVAAAGLPVQQPAYAAVASLQEARNVAASFEYPVVVKPANGGGGLGVLLVRQFDGMASIADVLGDVTNYDGGEFDGWLVEEYVKGTEVSVQGVVADGIAQIITYCEKVILLESDPVRPLLASFREAGHIAHPGCEADGLLVSFTQDCLAAVGYREGPFHVDLIRDGASLRLLEMGFRLSGMRVAELVQRVSGVDWAEAAFQAHLGKGTVLAAGSSAPRYRYGGQLTVRDAASVVHAERLAEDLAVSSVRSATVEVTRYNQPVLPAEWGNQIPDSLRSDVGRHAGAEGRVLVFADAAAEVSALLRRLSATATAVPEPENRE